MASWFTRALDRVTPWDRGGEVQRRQEKKKRDEEERQNRPTPNRNTRPNQQQFFNQDLNQGYNEQVETKKPVNIFETLNKNLTLGKPKTTVPVFKTPDTQPVEQPKPGTIIKPKQNLFDKVRDQFDANTEADKFRRQEENKVSVEQKPINYRNPVVDFAKRNASPTGLFNIGKELAQGTARFPIETAQTIEQSYRVSKEGTRLQKNGYPGFSNPQRDELARKNEPSKIWNPTGWQARLFGKGPVESIQTQSEKLSDTIDQATGKKPSAVGLTAALLALSVLPGGLLAKSFKTGAKGAKVGAKNIDELADVVNAAPTPRPAPVTQNIPINEIPTNPINVPVRNMTQPGQIIQEFPGDARIAAPPNLIKNQADDIRAQDLSNRFWDNKKTAIPDQRIQGVTPRTNEPFKLDATAIKASQDEAIDAHANFLRQVGEGNGVDINPVAGTRVSNNVRFGDTKGKRMTKADWREEAERQLKAGQADPSIQKIFDESADPEVQALLAKGEQPDVPVGRPITVKQVKGIDVRDETVVPQNLPETPGTVRATTATSPMAAKSEAVANMPVTTAPVSLPKVGDVLPSGKVVTKRMVETARRNRANTNKLAKAEEGTSDAYNRVAAARGQRTIVGDEPVPGHAKIGEIKKGERGNMYEVKNRGQGIENATQATQNTSIKEFIDTNNQKNLWNDDTMFEAEAILNRSYKMGNANPDELRILAKKVDEQASRKGQDLALLEKTSRKTDTSDKMTNKFLNRFYGKSESGSLTDKQIARVTKANDDFAATRDEAARKFELANDNPTKANVKAYQDAINSQKKLDKAARFEEFTVAKKALKGDKSPNAAKFLKQLEDAADVPNFDYVNANNLSGTGTIIRNNINSLSMALERLNVTGSNLRNVPKGIKEGVGTWWSEAVMRAKAGGKNPINWVKNWTTSGNTSGDAFLRGAAKGDATKYYRSQLKKSGYTGEELKNRTNLLVAQDPQNIVETSFMEQLQQVGLASLTHGGKARGKLENALVENISGYFGNIPVVKSLSKGLVNTLFGYPTITVRNAMRGIDRLGLGVPNVFKAGGLKAIGRGDVAKVELKQAARNFKSGAIVGGLGAALYNAGAISYGYPKDPQEQDRWKEERKSEYSIKIGGAWYPIPSMLGPFAIPLMAPGITLETLKDGGNAGDVAKALGKMIVDSSTPVDDFVDVGKALQGEETGNWWAQKAALLAGSQIPASGLLRQIAKMMDTTVRTADKDAEFFVQSYQNIIKALPGMSRFAPATLDENGQPFKHPNPLEIFAGASTKESKSGVQGSKDINQGINDTLSQIDKYGLLNDHNMDGVLKETSLKAYNKAKKGKQLDESDIKALKEGLVKGVSSEGTDTAYLEKGQYDTNLAVLKLKRDMMKEDPTTKPSSIKDIDTAIKRGEVYKNNKIPYDMISEYKSVGVDEWRKMGIAPDEKGYDADVYDPDMYQKLWDIDQLMTKSGVSYKKGSPEKNKYAAKEPAKGRGSGSGKGSGRGSGSGVRKIDTSFGTLKDGSFAPKVQAYESIATQSGGGVPRIGVKRPNIVHKISSSG